MYYRIAKMLAGGNFGEFSYLDYLGEKTWANGHQFAKFANFSPTNVFRYTVYHCMHCSLYALAHYCILIFYAIIKHYKF